MLKALAHKDDPQCQMSDAEVLTTALVAGLHFAGNLERARQCLKAPRYIPDLLSTSRLNRRLHAIGARLRSGVSLLGEVFKALHTESIYLIDGFPIVSGDNIRIPRAKRHQGEHYLGYYSKRSLTRFCNSSRPASPGAKRNPTSIFARLSFKAPSRSSCSAASRYCVPKRIRPISTSFCLAS